MEKEHQRIYIIFAVLGIALVAYPTTVFFVMAQDNQTVVEIQPPTTEEDTIPVEVTTANGTTGIVEVATGNSIESLLEYTTATFIPAIVGLAVAITSMIKLLPLSKKQKQGIEEAEKALQYVDTYAPKIGKQIARSGLLKIGLDLTLDRLEKISPGSKKEIEDQLARIPEYRDKAEDIEAEVREATAQLNSFRSDIVEAAKADNVPKYKLPRLSEGTVR